MTSIPDHYASLGIDPTADPEVIAAAYRALAKKFHPDTGSAAGTASPERFDQVQRAWEVLRTPESRHAYDLELLAATERELAEHLASRSRIVPRPGDEPRNPPPPDLGDIRPERASGPAAPPPPRAVKRPSKLPFAIPVLLLLAIAGGAAWLLLPGGPEAPQLPGAAKSDVAVATPAPSSPAPAPAPAPAAKPATTADAVPPPQPGAAAPDQPLFGSTATDGGEAASAQAQPVPDAPPAAAKPVFGSSADAQSSAAAPADVVAPPPLPKPRPAQPVRQAQVQKPPPKPVAPQKQASQQAPRARLQYQDPPQYQPQPDGYSDDGFYPPPGYYPPGFDPAAEPPPGFRPPRGRYRLVIFERLPGRQATAWSAGVVFKSIGKCTKQGVKAVLRRTGGMHPDGTRVWYECQQLTRR